ASSQPLAVQAGVDVLRRGGNAIDAAVTTAAVLSVVEPMNVGPGGDLFAIVYVAAEKKLYALDASGKAPSGQTLARMNAAGYTWNPANWGPGSGMPAGGILTVTVPGSVWGWAEVLRRFGTMTFTQTLQPAIDYAEQGFPISERIASDWHLPAGMSPTSSDPRGCCSRVDPDSIATWYIDGRPPAAGQMHKNPDLAKLFRILQQRGRAGFYEGEVASAIVAKSKALGGTMTMEDLAGYSGEWVDVAQTSYHGYEISTLAPPAQTWATGEMLNILESCVPVWAPGQTLASLGPANPKYWHFLVEAKKLAYGDVFAYNGDPKFVPVPLERLLSKSHAASLCGRVNPDRASRPAAVGRADSSGDTIVLSTADRSGNMVAWVNSLYSSFGSGVTVPGYGITLHNRGALFSLDPKSPNVIAPGKRPFNTLSAGFVRQSGRPLMTVTLMGGDMQAQGIGQVLVNVLDLGANVQAATDMARFRHGQVSNALSLESPLFRLVGARLKEMGHDVRSVDGNVMGGYQAIMFTPDPGAAGSPPGIGGFYRAGSDHRKDGQAAGF
ncbi:MAG TPA: gamma-glutamyltransferase family protein, partial [Vicinamibacterales bacterium]|nr:gamma-glutamyltransferase family protein [Vicinamibacterales bacterium]